MDNMIRLKHALFRFVARAGLFMVAAIICSSTQAAPAVSISPSSGPYSGGNSFLVTNTIPAIGNGFDITNVTVDSISAAVTGQGTNWVTVAAPSGMTTGLVDIVVQSMSEGDSTFTDAYFVNPAGEIGVEIPGGPSTLDYSTFLGGSSGDDGFGIAVDASGAIYVSGQSSSANFPVTNAYDSSHNGNNDIFVSKLSADGSTLLYSTYVGGTGSDYGGNIAVDSSGNAFVCGYTSYGFPTVNAHQTTWVGSNDAFLFKLSADGSTLLFSTYLGGSSSDSGSGVALDADGNPHITGHTYSSNFPTLSAYQSSLSGYSDIFVAKFSSTGALLYSTYLGGYSYETMDSRDHIAIGPDGSAYVTGNTQSSDFPTANAYQASKGDSVSYFYDAFVTKLATNGTSLIYSTYLGGTSSDYGHGIDVDADGNAYIVGQTESANWPTANAYQSSLPGYVAGFVSKLGPGGTNLIYSTYLGGSSIDYARAVAVDGTGEATVVGETSSSSQFPIVNAVQASKGDSLSYYYDAFVTRFDASGTNLIFSTYLGGSNYDYAYAVALDDSSRAIVAGQTGSSNFPTTNAYQTSLNGTRDAFVSIIGSEGVLSGGVEPSSGAWTGGYEVVISGMNLGNGEDITQVSLAGVPATIESQSPTQVVVTAGAGTMGIGDVVISSTSFGETVKSNGFAYVRATQAPLLFSPVSTQVYATTNALFSSGGSGTGTVSYAVLSGPGSIVGGTNLVMTSGTGVVTVVATKAQDALYFATSTTGTVTATKAQQSALSFSPSSPQGYATTNALTTTGGSGTGAFSYSVLSGSGSIVGSSNLVMLASSGEVGVQVTRLGDANYLPISTQAVVVATQAVQTINFGAIPAQKPTATVGLEATASSGLPVSFSLGTGPGTLTSGTNLSFSGVGDVVVVASQAGNSNYLAAVSVTNVVKVFSVSPANGPSSGGNSITLTNGTLGAGQDITIVTVDGVSAAVTGQGINWVTVTVPSGVSTGLVDIVVQSTSQSESVFPNAYHVNPAGGIGVNIAGGPLTLDYSTYLGGSSYDRAYGVAVDSSGAIYILGNTSSANFPITNSYSSTLAAYTDIFVSKLSADGSTLLYSTYVGGDIHDYGRGIAVDSSGNVFVSGLAQSGFPTVNAHQTTWAGNNDAVLFKLSADGSTLLFSTYLGGSDSDVANGLALDADGNPHITGVTQSSNLPTLNAYQSSFGGGLYDTFVAKFSSTGVLLYSTYLGGSSGDIMDSYDHIAIGPGGSAYVTGYTFSENFPTANAYQASKASAYDAFVTKLSTNGSSLVYSTYLGGSTSDDNGFGIDVDASGNAYIVGRTSATDWPTVNAYQSSRLGTPAGFVTKFGPSGTNLVYSTYLSGNGGDYVRAVTVNTLGEATVVGETTSTNQFPIINAVQSMHAGGGDMYSDGYDAFVTRFGTSGTNLIFSTYLGGSGDDYAYAVAVDDSSRAFVAGKTESPDFPTTNAYQSSWTGTDDAFVSIIGSERLLSGGVEPSSGVYTGGYEVVTSGTNLGNGEDITQVSLAGVPATIVSQSSTQVVVTAGASLPSIGDVVISSTSFGNTVKSNGFAYIRATQAPLIFNPTSTQVYATTNALVSSGGSGTGKVSYAVFSGPGSIVGGTNLVMTSGTGVVTVVATKAQDALYFATSTTGTVTATKAEQSALSFSPSSPQGYATTNALITTGGSGTGAFSYSVLSGPGSIADSSNLVMLASSGEVSVQATRLGDANYLPISTQAVVVATQAVQTISFGAISAQKPTATVGLEAMASSGLPVSFSLGTGPGTLASGTNLSFSGVGDVVVVASQAGNSNYLAAVSVTNIVKVFSVSPANGPSSGGNSITLTNGTLGAGQDITNVTVDGVSAAVTGQGINWVTVTVPSGVSTGLVDIVVQSTSQGESVFPNAYHVNSAGQIGVPTSAAGQTTLDYATYLGGSSTDYGYDVDVDATGSIYVVGYTLSADFPTTNSYLSSPASPRDVFVSKLSPDGATLEYSTYVGGASPDDGYGVAVDNSGNAFVVGYAYPGFPTTNAYQSTHAGGLYDPILFKLSADGSTLLFSTYFGGSGKDYGYSIALDSSGNPHITGITYSSDFPTTNAYQSALNGSIDTFVAKFSSSGALLYSTYLGGSGNEYMAKLDHIAVGADDCAYVSATTQSSDFPTTNALQSTWGGGYDAFVSKLSANGTSLVYSTYLGGSSTEIANGIAVDASGNVFLTGYTTSWNFPTANAYRSLLSGAADAYVTKISASGANLLYSTYLGGNGSGVGTDHGNGIAVDHTGQATVAGITMGGSFPIVNASQSTHAGGSMDAFVTRFDSSGSSLLFSSYFGGSGYEDTRALALDSSSRAIVVGQTGSSDLPVTNAYQSTKAGGDDAFVAIIRPSYALAEGIDPASGVYTGGYEVAISGTNLGNGEDITQVLLAGVPATIVSQSSTQLVVTAGASLPSIGDVVISSTSFGDTVKSNGFAYIRATQAPLIFNPTSTQVYATTNALVSSGGSGTGKVSYAVLSGPGSIVGGTNLVMTSGTGVVTVVATKAQDALYFATSTTGTVTATKAQQSALSFSPSSPQGYATTNALITTGGSGTGAFSYSVLSGPGSIVGSSNLVMLASSGEVSVQATRLGDANYLPISTQAVVVATQAVQTISFGAIPAQKPTATVGLEATASSGLPVSFSLGTGPGTLTSGTNLSFTGVGDVTVIASQAGNSNYLAAVSVTNLVKVFTVTPAIGPYVGGNSVVISNGFFGTITNVLFGSETATLVTNGMNWVSVIAPAAVSTGVVDITVQQTQGQVLLPAAYTYNPAGEIGVELPGGPSTLDYSTYLGGSSGDNGYGIAVDSTGAIYVSGQTQSANFPVTNAYDSTVSYTDIFVSKLSADGSTLLYSTYVGGTGYDYGGNIAVDSSGHAFVCGYASSGFPMVNAHQVTFSGSYDAVLFKLSTDGSALLFSTYLGGSSTDYAYGIALDADGNPHITGQTYSSNFPTLSAYQSSNSGSGDVFVSKFSSTGALLYSTYLGGSSYEDMYSATFDHIAIGPDGSAHVIANTYSANFPTANAYQSNKAGYYDAFVTKLATNGASLVYSTYLGGSSSDYGNGIDVDADGNAYIVGQTQSANWPTANAYQSSLSGYSAGFVSKLGPGGTNLIYSTYLGGSSYDYARAVAVNGTGEATVVGNTQSSAQFPIVNAVQPVFGGNSYDAFVTRFGASGTNLIFSTYLGGSGNEYAYAVAVDDRSRAIVAGQTDSYNFPTTNAYQTSLAGSSDSFVSIIGSERLLSTGVEPSIGLSTGGYEVVISGTNLGNGEDITQVLLAGAPATIDSQSSTQVVVTAGIPQMVGTGDVVVISTSFGATVKSNGFAYVRATQAPLIFNPASPQVYATTNALVSTAASSPTGSVSYAVLSGPGVIVGGTNLVITSGTGTVTVVAAREQDALYFGTSTTGTVTAAKAQQSILFSNPGLQLTTNVTALTATSGSGLPVSLSVLSGPATLSTNIAPASATYSTSGTVSVVATQLGDSNYLAALPVTNSYEVSLTPQAAMVFSPTSPQVYNTTNALVTSGGSGEGAVSYSVLSGPGVIVGGTNLVMTSGTGTVTVVATKAGDALYSSISSTGTVAAAKERQSIIFGNPGAQQTTNVTALGASASSGLPVTLTVLSGPVTLSTNIAPASATYSTSGTVFVVASQTGNTNYLTATPVTNTYAVTLTPQAELVFTPTSPQVYNTTNGLVATGGSSQDSLSYSVQSGPGSIIGSTNLVMNSGTGVVTVVATKAGDALYSSISTTGTVVAVKERQTIIFGNPGPQLTTNVTVLAASSDSGLPVALTVTGPASLSTNIAPASATYSTSGTVTVVASQLGNTNYLAATSVTNTFTVSLTEQTPLGFTPPSNQVYNTTNALTTTGGSGTGEVSYAVSSGPGSIVDGTNLVMNAGTGVVTVVATKAQDAWYSATSTTSTVFALKAEQTIDFNNPGSQLTTNVTALTATSGSGLPVSLSISGPAQLSTNIAPASATYSTSGTVSVVASQLGNTNWLAAVPVTNIYMVSLTPQSELLFTPTSPQTFNTTNALSTSGGSGEGAVSYAVLSGLGVIMGSTNLYAGSGTGSIVVQATRAADAIYSSEITAATVTLQRASQSIIFPNPGTQFWTNEVALVAGATSGSEVSFAVESGPALVADGTNMSFTGYGTVSVVASQLGNTNWLAASAITNSFSVLGPQLSVLGTNGAVIASSNLVSVADGSDFDEVIIGLEVVTNIFTVTNAGSGLLTFSDVATNGPQASSFVILEQTNALPVGGSLDVPVVFTPQVAGSNTASLVFSFDGTNAPYTVNLSGVGIGGGIQFATNSLHFAGTYADSDPKSQSILMTNIGVSAFTWTSTIEYSAGASNWLSVLPDSGTLSLPGSTWLTNAVDISNLVVGSYTATVSVAAFDATNSPQHYVVSLSVGQAPQSVTFVNPGSQVTTNITSLTANADSGLPVTLQVVSGPATLSTNIAPATLTYSASGTVSVVATQLGDSNWLPAAAVTNTFEVSLTDQAPLVFTPASPQTYATTTPLSTTGGSGQGSVSYAVLSGPGSIASATNLYAGSGTGSIVVEATKASDGFYSAQSVSATVTLQRASQAILFPNPGAQLATNETWIAALSSSGLDVDFAVTSGPATLEDRTNGTYAVYSTAGSVSIVATQGGNTNWFAAPAITNTFAVSKAIAQVILSNTSQYFTETPREVTVTTVPSNLTVSVTYDGSAIAPTNIGTYAVTGIVQEARYVGTGVVSMTVFRQADLVMTKTAPATVNGGQDITYTLSVSNAGPTIAYGVVVTDALPAKLTFVSSSSADSTNDNGTVLWAPGRIPLHSVTSITVRATAEFEVDEYFITNTAVVAGGDTDTVSSNNVATHVVRVLPYVSLTTLGLDHTGGVALAGSPEPFGYGTTSNILTYTVLTNSVVSPADTTNGTRWVSTGYTGTGSIPATGTGTTVIASMTNDSTLTWQWHREYWQDLSTTNGSIVDAQGNVQSSDWQRLGSSQTYYAVAASNYTFNYWVYNGQASQSTQLTVFVSSTQTISASFSPVGQPPSRNLEINTVTTRVNNATGLLEVDIEFRNLASSTVPLLAPYWYVSPSNQYTYLWSPDGTEPTSGYPYVDVTEQATNSLASIGNLDANLDPGESVIVTNILFYSPFGQLPTGQVFAVWAELPPYVDPDTDGDGYTDSEELAAGTNPVDASSRPVGAGWWYVRGVVSTNTANDYAAANAGQVKWIALQAYLELDARLENGAGAAVSNAVSGFSSSNNYYTVNIGQLKNLAKPFYDRLIAENIVTNYPWSATTSDDADNAAANIGQVKYLFDF